MFDRPDPATLLFGLAAFLEHDVRPALTDPALAFRVRIAAHVAQTLALQDGAIDGALRASLRRGHALLGETAPEPTTRGALVAAVAALDERLAIAIRDGVVDEDAALAHYKASLAAELAVTNPAFDLHPRI